MGIKRMISAGLNLNIVNKEEKDEQIGKLCPRESKS
jgi:uncharacterized protein YwbE